LFVLAFTHAVLQERRQFIPQGFSKFYEFSSADLRMAAEIVVRVCANAARSGGQVQWDDIHGLLSHTIYGGRIDSPFDFAVLQTCVLMPETHSNPPVHFRTYTSF